MKDPIKRQAAIDAILAVTGNSSVRELYEHVQEHGLSDMWSGGVNAAIDIIIAVPSAQPDVPDINVEDMVSRQEAIDALDEIESEVADGDGFQYEKWRRYFCELPSAPDRCDTCRFVYYPKETNNNDQ